ncbi:ubiquitin carboxyl-terminal hydrolase 2-like isoform X2 [Anthonomus grandis grandis]|uniref:ubiquitin carboxyl-terminal hydrolase 2-like isoform X2 n=1 Tax=Anthonomus grandis grandis TaxID=2921223 RepID=UPI00216507EF|nr:ubiquitin carboxyl-terminal hydrolase 2-like isoform X2 [Anthonomus grandis grandis]
MPVLSPQRSSSSGLTGSYRSTYTSALDRPYYGGSSYTPRVSTYSERFTSRSYTDTDGRRVFSRSGSITEDGITTRFREESREGSLSRDSGISSIREGSVLDYPRRDSSLIRSDRLSTSGVIESVAELRNKYSPANYVPAIYRNKTDNISRSKSINDIGLPPIEPKATSPSVQSRKKQELNGVKAETNGELEKVNGEDQRRSSVSSRGSARVNQCASFIPNEPPSDELESENEKIGRKYSYDVSASTPPGGGAKGGGRNVAALAGPSSRRSLVTPPADGDDDELAQARRGTAADARHGLGLVGLRNIGNTCFMNSVLQCLSNTRVLLDYIRKDTYQKDINTTTSSMKGALVKAFAEVIKELWAPDPSGPVNTAALKSQIQRFAPRFMGYSQQDAQEFLRYLLEGLHEDVNRVTIKPKPITTDIDDNLPDSEKAAEAWRRYLRSEDSLIVDAFVGQLKSTLKCTHCGHCSVTFDPFWDLSLPLPSGRSSGPIRLSHCLEAFTKEETLDGDEKPKCAKCKERRRCTKSFAIQRFPQVLVIHLKRFSPLERFRGKLNALVEFPVEGLDLTHYAAEAQSGPSPRYSLYAVSEHSGTPYSGHYTAHCKNPVDSRWHEYNDSRVSSASARSAVSPEAYVLFYEREGGATQRSRL